MNHQFWEWKDATPFACIDCKILLLSGSSTKERGLRPEQWLSLAIPCFLALPHTDYMTPRNVLGTVSLDLYLFSSL
jgi:hypothetical protein